MINFNKCEQDNWTSQGMNAKVPYLLLNSIALWLSIALNPRYAANITNHSLKQDKKATRQNRFLKLTQEENISLKIWFVQDIYLLVLTLSLLSQRLQQFRAVEAIVF